MRVTYRRRRWFPSAQAHRETASIESVAGALQDIQSLLDQVLRRVADDTQSVQVLAPLWRDLNPSMAANTQLVSWNQHVLTVRCSSEVWQRALQHDSAALLAQLRLRLGDQAPTTLSVQFP